MNSKRIKEIQETTAYPESVSVHQALLQVWNECEQSESQEPVKKVRQKIFNTRTIERDMAVIYENYIREIHPDHKEFLIPILHKLYAKLYSVVSFQSKAFVPKSIFTRRIERNNRAYDFVVKHKVLIYQNTRNYLNFTEGKGDRQLQELIDLARKEIGYSDKTWSGDIFNSLVNLYKKICV
jgi:hypothetical protein